jgi:hypothetical protein
MSVVKDVNSILAKRVKKDSNELKAATIQCLSPEYLFSSNGVYFFCGKIGTGKSYLMMKHILVTERLFKQPYYDLIIFTSTSKGADKTVESLKEDVSTPIQFIPDSQLLVYLERHLKMKQKFYAMCQFILSNLQKPNDTMQQTIKKHGFIKHDKELDREKLFKYMAQKFDKYKFKTYPTNTLLILDDFAGHPLIAKETSDRKSTRLNSSHCT